MKFLYLFILNFIVFGLVGQTITAKKFGSSGTDYVESIAADANGNYYVMGRFGGTMVIDSAGVSKTFTTTNPEASFIIKYNNSDQFVWAFTIENTCRFYHFGSLKFHNGNLYATTNIYPSSKFRSADGSTLNVTIAGTYAGILVKLNSNGIYQYHSTVESSTGYTELSDIALTSTGEIFVTGRYAGTATVKGQSSTSATTGASLGSMDAMYFKFDNAGKSEWIKTGGGSADDISCFIHIDKNDNLYMTHQFGGTTTFGTYVLTTSATWGSIYTKIDKSNGAIIWLQKVDGAASVEGGIQTDDAGNLYFTGGYKGIKAFGSISSGTIKTVTAAGGFDMYVAKYSPDGNIIWVISLGSTGDEFGWRSVMRNNKLYFHFNYGAAFDFVSGGSTYTFSSSGSTDGAVVGLDSSGACFTRRTSNGSGSEKFWAIQFASNGNLLVGGHFSGTTAMNSTSVTAVGGQDGFMYILDSAAAAQGIETRPGKYAVQPVYVYPNPGSGVFNISVNPDKPTLCSITVFDILGQAVYETKQLLMEGDNTTTIDLSFLSSGVYTIRLDSIEQQRAVRVIKD